MQNVECINLCRHYSEGESIVRALDSINLKINSGEFVSLVGPSGSGKTTLLNLIGGLDRPTAGEVIVCGQNLNSLSKGALADFRLNKLGFIFQAYNLIPVLTALENVEFTLELQGLNRIVRQKRAREILSLVGLAGMEDRRPAKLSGGQQQRVAVARALVGEPKIILADEPTANLDSKTAESLLELMRDMNKERGVTFIFSTHDKLVMDFARRIVNLRDGHIVADENKN